MCGKGELSLSRQRLANGLTTPAAFLLRMLLMQLINSFCLLTTEIYFYNKLIQMKLVTGSAAPRISKQPVGTIVEMSARYLWCRDDGLVSAPVSVR